ncbi:MAG TPA: hypothetical protein VH478_03610 [Trebonia sp.]|jgi:hypothetical protein|nr:hypothetical protein [Trebonia sp.]
MSDVRRCEQCGREFVPRREHSRFCSAECRLAWNTANARSANVSAAALDWSLTAMSEAVGRLARARTLDPRHAAVAVSDATWWVTIVDATLVRYLPGGYDATLDAQPPPQRAEIEQTLAGLRYVRNQMGVHIDPVEFISQGGGGLRWSPLPPPLALDLSPRGQDWERGRYRAYQERLAGHSITRTFAVAARFLRLAAVPMSVAADDDGQPQGASA